MDEFVIVVVLVMMGLILLLAAIILSNSVKRANITVIQSLSGIDVALTQRYDQITQLAKVCKAYLSAEQKTLIDAINLRQGATISQIEEVSDKLNQIASQLKITAESYPELKSASLYAQLMTNISETELNLSAARRLYNSNASYFNSKRIVFPSSIFAKKYPAYELFHAEAHKQEVPELDI